MPWSTAWLQCRRESQSARKPNYRLGSMLERSERSRLLWTPYRNSPKLSPENLLRRLRKKWRKTLQWAVAQLSNGKAGPCIRSGSPADQGRYGRAVAEIQQAVVGQRAQAPQSACAQSIAEAWTVAAATGPSNKKTKMQILPSYPNLAKTWEMPNIGEPLRCSVTLARLGPRHPFVNLSGPCQFGSLLCGRNGHPGKCVREIH